jgi:two-component system OmpR family sensor kinase
LKRGWLVALLSGTLGVAIGRWSQRLESRGIKASRARASEERLRFLRRLDHELKNPLTAIRAGLANLDTVPDQEERHRIIASIEAQVVHLGRLTTSLRKLAELETRPMERLSVDVLELLQAAYGFALEHPLASKRQIALVVPEKRPPWPTVTGDRDLLSLAVYNLLDNALKFTHTGDTIELRGFVSGSTIIIEVADTGPGILPGDEPQVWEELYRGQEARSIPGSGIGLALVRTIVERHGGQVSLHSEVGRGAIFTLWLPAEDVSES